MKFVLSLKAQSKIKIYTKMLHIITTTLLIFMTLLSSTFAGENESVSCPDAPTGYVETTPYSTMTISLMANGKPAIGLFEYYKSVTFVEDCDGTYIPSSTSIPISTSSIF